MVLRYYQRNAKSAAFRGWKDYISELIHLGTGGGKTVIAAKMVEAATQKGKRSLFLADSNELCEQPLTVIHRATGIICGLEKANHRASLQSDVVVGSSQTLSRKDRRERFPRNFFDIILVDEAHRGADRDREILDHFETAHICGFTATPFRSGLRNLSKYYEHVCFSMPMLNLVDQGFAPPLLVMTVPLEIDLTKVHQSMTPDGKDYKAEELETTIAPYYDEIIEEIKKNASDRQIIVFLPLVRSSIAFAELCRQHGLAARHVDGNSPDRSEIIEAFAMKRFQVITNSDLLSTGVDIPTADCLVNLSPTRSAAKYQQRVGRIMRPLPGVIDSLPEEDEREERKERIKWSDKPNTLILDFLFLDQDFGVMRPAHLVAKDEFEAKAIYEKCKEKKTPEELAIMAQLTLAEKEKTLIKSLEAAAAKGGKGLITYDTVALATGDMGLMDWEPTARWHNQKPSKAQLESLARWGVDVSSIDTKGRASVLMDSLINRSKQGLATIKQVRFLKRLGVDEANSKTFEEAVAIINRRKESWV